ncbi:MAG: Fic family protein [Deltaproteobacteria bacterium]|jgi:fido (protein-threonine AMPylation protein)|nr:Fic family protein [Deltaproteobacteria bacterium]
MIDDTNYTEQTEPDYQVRSYNWKTAIGLQQVDGIRPSDYLVEIANKNIEGQISLDEAEQRLAEYYEHKPAGSKDENRSREADIVSLHIAKILASWTFKLSPLEIFSIHRQLFQGVFDHAGKIRDCNLSKREWVLGGASVVYDDFRTARASLDYDFDQEKEFDYSMLDDRQAAEHIAKFISGLWQIHPFREGNTRLVAVFTIKYLRKFGYDLANDTFEKNAWYFRNALVRANFSNRREGVSETYIYLNRFFGNLLLGETNELKNRDLHASQKASA